MTRIPHDQTRGDSTPYIGDGQAASLSLNEVTSLCMKAARGAGMSWGLAEEAGFAATWLVEHGFDGPGLLYAQLDAAQGRQWQDLCPTVAPGHWHAQGDGALCPIAVGAALCDYAGLAEGIFPGCAVQIGMLDHPVLLIPFLATIALSSDIIIGIEWRGGTVCIDGAHDGLTRAVNALDGLRSPFVIRARSGQMNLAHESTVPGIAADTIAGLNELAMRTTVPASEASRAGAGATSSDND